MRHNPFKPSRQAQPASVTATIAAGLGVISGTGFALALNNMGSWVIVIAAATVVVTAWTEGRHIAATKRQLAGLDTLPGPRKPGDDNPPSFAGS